MRHQRRRKQCMCLITLPRVKRVLSVRVCVLLCSLLLVRQKDKSRARTQT